MNTKKDRYIFGTLHILATKNNTIIHATDITGTETISRISSGCMAKNNKDKKSGYYAMLASQEISKTCKKIGLNAFHVKIRAKGGSSSTIIGQGASIVIRSIIREGFKIGRIEDATPTPTNGTRKKGGRRGRRV
mmetsp:Transcript_14283/g.19873  ORF Transcript_14283/g.19873 Transcript_14283/m.19873 type:complete len:134 (+) Transcript_14283:2428-2829(+)